MLISSLSINPTSMWLFYQPAEKSAAFLLFSFTMVISTYFGRCLIV
ncbi:hypothetical protein [Bacillus sp. 22-7]